MEAVLVGGLVSLFIVFVFLFGIYWIINRITQNAIDNFLSTLFDFIKNEVLCLFSKDKDKDKKD